MEDSSSNPAAECNVPAVKTGLQESLWQLAAAAAAGDPLQSYPQRPGEQDCGYYVRSGLCGYGSRCRFNHPRARGRVARDGRSGRGEYPERIDEPVCQYFMKTGTCKFGSSCKFHHPKYGGGLASTISLNYHGYPLRLGEKECSFYLKTGHCKFGATCKFHHPQPNGIDMPSPAPSIYQSVLTPPVPSLPLPGWQIVRPSLFPGSYVRGPYGHVLVSPGVVQIPGWSQYPQPPMSPAASPSAQHAAGPGMFYGLTQQLSPLAPAYPGPVSSLPSSVGPSTRSQREHLFPERPGQPECRYYMRTGDCRYGSLCKYHHPAERSMLKKTFILSPMGLPLRPGAQACTFYSQHGVCKFGSACKFDHSVVMLSHSPSASSLADMPVAPYPVESTTGILSVSTMSSELRPEVAAGSIREPFPARTHTSENASSGSVGSMPSEEGASIPDAHVQLSAQSCASVSGSSSFVVRKKSSSS